MQKKNNKRNAQFISTAILVFRCFEYGLTGFTSKNILASKSSKAEYDLEFRYLFQVITSNLFCSA